MSSSSLGPHVAPAEAHSTASSHSHRNNNNNNNNPRAHPHSSHANKRVEADLVYSVRSSDGSASGEPQPPSARPLLAAANGKRGQESADRAERYRKRRRSAHLADAHQTNRSPMESNAHEVVQPPPPPQQQQEKEPVGKPGSTMAETVDAYLHELGHLHPHAVSSSASSSSSSSSVTHNNNNNNNNSEEANASPVHASAEASNKQAPGTAIEGVDEEGANEGELGKTLGTVSNPLLFSAGDTGLLEATAGLQYLVDQTADAADTAERRAHRRVHTGTSPTATTAVINEGTSVNHNYNNNNNNNASHSRQHHLTVKTSTAEAAEVLLREPSPTLPVTAAAAAAQAPRPRRLRLELPPSAEPATPTISDGSPNTPGTRRLRLAAPQRLLSLKQLPQTPTSQHETLTPGTGQRTLTTESTGSPSAVGGGGFPAAPPAPAPPQPPLPPTPQEKREEEAPQTQPPQQRTSPSRLSSDIASHHHHHQRYPPSLTPTPAYPDGGATPHGRRHSALPLVLPAAPAPVPFDLLVQHYVEDTYVIEKKVSEGTYGEVYVGKVKGSPREERVALKRLKTLRGLDGFPLTSLREVIALQHVEAQRRRQRRQQPKRPHALPASEPLEEIIRLRHVLLSREEPHNIFLVFDYASCSLSGLLHRRFLFETHEVSYVFRKIINGVRQLHAMGVIHRDIKSDNILLTDDGRVQLADFGLCVFKNSDGRALTPSMINLNYRPPEMLLGGTTYDEKVDIWSIGCMLAQLYLGVPPFYRKRNEVDKAKIAQHNRTAETELEQLAVIADVLGPLPLHVFPEKTCKHIVVVQQLKREYLAQFRQVGGGGGGGATGPPQSDVPLAKVEALFQPSFLFSQFNGLRGWFVAQLENREPSLVGGRPQAPPLRPTISCLDVLAAILQYDPERRPTAAQLLEMPFFSSSVAPKDQMAAAEEQLREALAKRLEKYANSHT